MALKIINSINVIVFYSNKSKDYPVPRMIELVGDRDIWTWKYGNETKFFFAGAHLHNTEPNSDF